MSDKYTYADVIIDPEDPRVEIGKEYYFGNNPGCLLRSISQISASEGTLVMKDSAIEAQSSPFMSSEGEWFVCIIRKKEPEKKYVPFDLTKEEDRNFLKGRWIKTDGDEEKITGFERDDDGVWHIKISADYLLSEDMLNLWKFDGGLPCGKLVEETV